MTLNLTKFSELPGDWVDRVTIITPNANWSIKQPLELWLRDLGYQWGIHFIVSQTWGDKINSNDVHTYINCYSASLAMMVRLKWA